MSDKQDLIAIAIKIIIIIIESIAKQLGASTEEVKARVLAALAKPEGDATDKVAEDIEAAIKGASPK